MSEYLTAKMDRRTKLLTMIIVVLFPSIAISSFFMQPPKPTVSVFLTLLLLGVIPISYGFVPKRIAVSDSQLLIQNFYGPVLINLKNIKMVQKIENTGFNLRTFGVGGLFGYFGYFNAGDVWYVTNIHKKIKITLNSGKNYMISPEDPDDLFNVLLERTNFATV